MRKKLQNLWHGHAFIILLLILCAFAAIAGTITIAGSGTNSSVNVKQTQALDAQKKLVLDSIAKNDQKTADAGFQQLITEFAKNPGLAEAVYKIGTEYQYKNWNAAKANEAHKFNIENFPGTKYAMLSNVEIIRSQLRTGKNADSDVEKFMNAFKNRMDFAAELPNAIYLIAQAYSNNKKDAQAQPLFEYVSKTYPKDVYGILSQVRIDAIKKDYDAADVVADYLIARYRDNAEVEKAIKSLAEYYRTNKEYSRSIHFYSSIIVNYENTEDPVKPYIEIIYNLIDMKDTQGARDQIEAMQKSLSGNTKLARANFDVANYFLKANDSASALKLHAYNVEHYTTLLESLWSQAAIVWYHVRAGDEENAYIEYAKMLSTYKDQPTLPKEVAQVGDIYTEIGNTTKARELHNYVMTQWPQSEYVFNAKAGLIRADIYDSSDEAAMTSIDTLMTEYKDKSELPNTIFTFGEIYWDKAKIKSQKYLETYNSSKVLLKSNNASEAQGNYIKAQSVMERVINNFPDSDITAQAHLLAAETNRILKKNDKSLENYQKIVEKWPNSSAAEHSQFMIARLFRNMGKGGQLPSEEAKLSEKKAYEELIKKFPGSLQAENARKWLENYEKQLSISNSIKKEKRQISN